MIDYINCFIHNLIAFIKQPFIMCCISFVLGIVFLKMVNHFRDKNRTVFFRRFDYTMQHIKMADYDRLKFFFNLARRLGNGMGIYKEHMDKSMSAFEDDLTTIMQDVSNLKGKVYGENEYTNNFDDITIHPPTPPTESTITDLTITENK